MLRLLSDLNQVTRFDVPANATLISSGVAETGTYVVNNGGTLELPTTATAVGAMAVFTESNRDGSAGWSPDVTSGTANTLTVLLGKYRATTDQYGGTPAAGTPLKANASGKLVEATVGTDHINAVCVKGPHTVRHLQNDYTVIEIITV